MKPLFTVFMLAFAFHCSAQVTLFYENFNSGASSNFELNTTDVVNGVACTTGSQYNQWIINNAYAGTITGSIEFACPKLGGNVPAEVKITSTPNEPSCVNGFPNSYYLHIHSPIVSDSFAVYNSDWAYNDGICIPTEYYFAKTTKIVSSGYTGVTLSFWWACGAETAFGQLYYSTDGGNTWKQLGSNYYNQLTWTQQSITDAAFDNQADLRFGFMWNSNTSNQTLKNDPAFSIDDVVVNVPSVGVAANTISRGLLNNSTVCPCSNISIPFTSTGTFGAGNTYYARLSDANGDFTNSTIIGSVASSANSGTINATIPCFVYQSGSYLLRVESDEPAIKSPNGSNVEVSNITTAGVNAFTSSTTLCSAAPATFRAYPYDNSGYASSFQWYVNGAPVGTNSSTYTYTPTNGDQVKVVMTSTGVCVVGSPATSNVLPMTIAANAPVTVTLVSFPPAGSSLCYGISNDIVQYLAIPGNGGASSTYQWKEDGALMDTPTTSPVLITNFPNDNRVFSCFITSGSGCITGADTATSAPIIFNVDTLFRNTLSATQNGVCSSTAIKLTSTNPNRVLPFEWQVAGSVPGAFADIPGVTTATDSTSVSQTTFFRVIQHTGHCADTSNILVATVSGPPNAGFTYMQTGAIVSFTAATNMGPVIYDWNFGDGSPHSTMPNPTHTYTSDSTYTVCLTVYSGASCTGCHADSCTAITISGLNGISSVGGRNKFSVYPNPFSTTCTIQSGSVLMNATLKLFDVTGKEVESMENVNGSEIILQRNDLPQGVYMLQLQDGEKMMNSKLVIE